MSQRLLWWLVIVCYQTFTVHMTFVSFDGGVIYRVQDKVFQFIVHGICTIGSLDNGMNVFITPTMLERHGVDVETFFEDVKKCYNADGIDILSERYKS